MASGRHLVAETTIGAGVSAMLVRSQIAYNVPNLVRTLGSGTLGGVSWIPPCSSWSAISC